MQLLKGLDMAPIVAELRTLADRIERGSVVFDFSYTKTTECQINHTYADRVALSITLPAIIQTPTAEKICYWLDDLQEALDDPETNEGDKVHAAYNIRRLLLQAGDLGYQLVSHPVNGGTVWRNVQPRPQTIEGN